MLSCRFLSDLCHLRHVGCHDAKFRLDIGQKYVREVRSEVTVEIQQITSRHYRWHLWNQSHLLDW